MALAINLKLSSCLSSISRRPEHPRGMYVADAVHVIAQRPRDVAIHDLSVVDVIQEVFTRGELTRLHTSSPHAT